MIICRTIEEFRAERANLHGEIGFVPTMGALHKGHLSLVQAAWSENAHTVASIFVNPSQFNDPQDLAKYPRQEKRDLVMLETEGVSLVFIPPADLMYPTDFQTSINVEKVSQGLEGAHRPGHFRGVATVVAKLFNIVQPTRAYFGQKDAQQVAVIRQMVSDLNFPIEIKTCPTQREADGLALSSRNANLSAPERRAASILFKALNAAQTAYQAGERHPKILRDTIEIVLGGEKLAHPDYISVADYETLEELEDSLTRPALLSLAVVIGETRLIDNMLVG